MENIKLNETPKFEIENIKISEGNELSVSFDRGGIITSLVLKGKEILYLDRKTFEDSKLNVKGGVPILFPNAGAIPDEIKTEELKNLKQHGFVRDIRDKGWAGEQTEKGFKMELVSSPETREIYPYDFRLVIEGIFEEDGSFTIIQTVENLEEDKEMPISSGLHPYFKVPSEEKKNIKFNFEGGEIAEEQIEKWANGTAVSIENPNVPIEVNIPGLGTLVFTFSEEFQRIWVWSQEGKDFVCIEPVMRNKGGIVLDPVKIKPNEKHVSKINILLRDDN